MVRPELSAAERPRKETVDVQRRALTHRDALRRGKAGHGKTLGQTSSPLIAVPKSQMHAALLHGSSVTNVIAKTALAHPPLELTTPAIVR